MPEKNVWALLFTEDDVRHAEELVAAVIGVDADPTILAAELQRVCDRVVPAKADAATIAKNLTSFVAALATLARSGLSQFATVVAEAKEQDPEDPAVRRPLEVHLLGVAVESVLDTHRGDGK
jgi:hypothetical protein